MTEIGSFEAKTHFGDLLRRVARERESFVVTMRGKPVALPGPIGHNKPSAENLSALLEELRAFRAGVAARGPILEPGESWKDFAREGLD